MPKKLKILFVARAYPPTVGGIENQNYELIRSLDKFADVIAITNSKGKSFLPIFYIIAVIRAICLNGSYEVVILGDGVSAPFGRLIKALVRKPVFCILHGLDLSFRSRIYQYFVVKHSLPNLDLFFAVGNTTRNLAISKGLNPDLIYFIPNGVNSQSLSEDRSDRFPSEVTKSLAGQRYYLTLGRLVKRKGVSWFIQNVLPNLESETIYVVAGDGPERSSIEHLSKRHKNIIFIGRTSHSDKKWLLKHALAFIQPNIPVENDIEGFGLVVLEASAMGTPVVASRLEGLQDSIHDGKNGVLANPLDAEDFIGKIELVNRNLRSNPNYRASISEYTLTNFDWDSIAIRYLKIMDRALMLSKNPNESRK